MIQRDKIEITQSGSGGTTTTYEVKLEQEVSLVSFGGRTSMGNTMLHALIQREHEMHKQLLELRHQINHLIEDEMLNLYRQLALKQPLLSDDNVRKDK